MPSLTLQFLLAAVAAVSAFLAGVCLRRCGEVLREMRATVSSVSTVRSKVEVHDAELDRISDALAKLRGLFYSERSAKRSATSNSDFREEATGPATSKDELRRRVGLVAGSVPKHREPNS
jgi:hypothetical protein